MTCRLSSSAASDPAGAISAFAASPPQIVDANASAVQMVWSYMGELIFNLLVLVGAVKMSERVVKEMIGV